MILKIEVMLLKVEKGLKNMMEEFKKFNLRRGWDSNPRVHSTLD